jgi:hypothetical protein
MRNILSKERDVLWVQALLVRTLILLALLALEGQSLVVHTWLKAKAVLAVPKL